MTKKAWEFMGANRKTHNCLDRGQGKLHSRVKVRKKQKNV